MEKRRNCSLGAISPFSTIFSIYLLTSGVKLHIHLINVIVWFIVFFNSANLICRDTDVSKYSRDSLGLRDNESTVFGTLKICPKDVRATEVHLYIGYCSCPKWTHNVETTSIQRWFNVKDVDSTSRTLNQRWIEDVSSLCASWVC